jgi:hypothetical protein
VLAPVLSDEVRLPLGGAVRYRPFLGCNRLPHPCRWLRPAPSGGGDGSAAKAKENDGGKQEDEVGKDAEPAEEPETARQRAFCERGREGPLADYGRR